MEKINSILTPDEVNQIIREYLEKERFPGRKVSVEAELDVEHYYRGDDNPPAYFAGYSYSVE